uniref:Uncharacterized protein n=1 Tax=Vitrella brassicaformis TaxID=1169539 RepID=A0A7S1JTX0_9ALVE
MPMIPTGGDVPMLPMPVSECSLPRIECSAAALAQLAAVVAPMFSPMLQWQRQLISSSHSGGHHGLTMIWIDLCRDLITDPSLAGVMLTLLGSLGGDGLGVSWQAYTYLRMICEFTPVIMRGISAAINKSLNKVKPATEFKTRHPATAKALDEVKSKVKVLALAVLKTDRMADPQHERICLRDWNRKGAEACPEKYPYKCSLGYECAVSGFACREYQLLKFLEKAQAHCTLSAT